MSSRYQVREIFTSYYGDWENKKIYGYSVVDTEDKEDPFWFRELCTSFNLGDVRCIAAALNEKKERQ